MNIQGITYGERSCFIAINRTAYCFYRDIDHHLKAIAMNGTTIIQDIHMDVHPGMTKSLFILFCLVFFIV